MLTWVLASDTNGDLIVREGEGHEGVVASSEVRMAGWHGMASYSDYGRLYGATEKASWKHLTPILTSPVIMHNTPLRRQPQEHQLDLKVLQQVIVTFPHGEVSPHGSWISVSVWLLSALLCSHI